MSKEFTWDMLECMVKECTRCPLCKGRTHAVLGEGNPRAALLCIGEGPGAQEDAQGRPFVGPAGKLLDRMLAAIDLPREQVYIANVVKCRPPGNRNPAPEEAAACLPYLRAQVYLIRPKVILLLGATAAKYTLDENIRITRDRGQWTYRGGAWMLATYHPAALLRDASKKVEAWEDMQAVRDKLAQIAAGEAAPPAPAAAPVTMAPVAVAPQPQDAPNLVDMAVANMAAWAREITAQENGEESEG